MMTRHMAVFCTEEAERRQSLRSARMARQTINSWWGLLVEQES
jgi:hypothetical protein